MPSQVEDGEEEGGQNPGGGGGSRCRSSSVCPSLSSKDVQAAVSSHAVA